MTRMTSRRRTQKMAAELEAGDEQLEALLGDVRVGAADARLLETNARVQVLRVVVAARAVRTSGARLPTARRTRAVAAAVDAVVFDWLAGGGQVQAARARRPRDAHEAGHRLGELGHAHRLPDTSINVTSFTCTSACFHKLTL